MAPTPKSPGTFGQIFQHIIQEQRPRINIITFSWVTQLNYWHWSDAKPSDQQKAIKLKPAREVPRLGPIAKGPFCQWHILHPIPTMLISKSLNHYQAYWFHGENKYNWGASQSFGFSIWMRTTISTAKPNLCQQKIQNSKFGTHSLEKTGLKLFQRCSVLCHFHQWQSTTWR